MFLFVFRLISVLFLRK
uniref:Uncharacterized protein n=1 Tax=Anguilla anguilla TaxID=7936 RepID=A0A0E9XXS9_ANGAN